MLATILQTFLCRLHREHKRPTFVRHKTNIKALIRVQKSILPIQKVKERHQIKAQFDKGFFFVVADGSKDFRRVKHVLSLGHSVNCKR